MAPDFEMTPRQRLLSLLGCLFIIALWLFEEPSRDTNVVRAEPTTIVLLVVSIALSLAAQYLIKPKAGSIARDDKPTTLATRGAYIPYVIGRRRVGAVFLWAGDRTTRKEKTGGGGKGGGKTQKTKVYYESAMHALCLGPGKRLHRITQNGKAIFVGPIDAASHPSGTTVDLGKEGSFKVYWGEAHQPINTTLGAVSRIGISSRWPYLCYIHWITKRLGTSAQWQLMDYDVETSTASSRLVESPSYFPPSRTVVATTYSVTAVTNGAPRTAKITIAGHKKKFFTAGGYLKLNGNAATNRDYRIYKVSNVITGTFPFYVAETEILLDDVLTSANVAGNVQAYTINEDDGYNHAHLFDQLVFEPWPHGCGMDRTEWDHDALEELGRTCSTEGLRASVIAQDGEEAKAVVATIMQDVGFVVGMDPTTGRIRPRAVRTPTGTIPNLSDDILLPPRPEITISHDERQMDRSVYVFADRELGFRDMTITKDDDAEASRLGRPKTRKVQIATATNFATASQIAERRAQEDMAGTVVYKVNASRQARLLQPGQAFTASGLPGTLRCMSMKPDPLTGRVEIEAMSDFYGADASTFVNNDTAFTLPVYRTDEDFAFTLLEVPAYLVIGKQLSAAMPRIRSSANVVSALAHLSADDVTYTQVGTDFDVQTGGTLATAITATDPSIQTQGPTIDAQGPDIAEVLDLSSDTTNWRLGRQLALIDDELFFVQKLTSLGGGQYRLDGLIRARYDTARAAHSIGAVVYLFTTDTLATFEDALLSPGATRYLKSQPQGGESLPLSEIVPISKTLRGKGITPMDPLNLRVVGGTNAYVTGNPVDLQWSYRSALVPKTGAGLQPAGGPCGVSPVDGQFQVQITTTGDVIKREFTQVGTTYTYSVADRTTDALEGSNFKVKVKNVSSGYASSEVVITVVNVP